MSQSAGLPARLDFTPVPSAFLGQVLGEIDDLGELKCALRVFWHLHQRKGSFRAVDLAELGEDRVITQALVGEDPEPSERLQQALEQLRLRGIFLVAWLPEEGKGRYVVLLNTPQNHGALSRRGATLEASVPGISVRQVGRVDWPNIFRLYEENIGLLTPLIAEELKDADAVYPEAWIREAFQEAVRRNRRSWRYISRILERWAQEGKDNGNGESERHTETVSASEYLRKYGIRKDRSG